MKQQVFFLHSAGAQGPQEGSNEFVTWLATNLGPDYEVIHPIMPHPEDPDYRPWKAALRKELPLLKDDVILIGHSLGGSVLLKYLTEEAITARIKGIFLCATPFWGADEDWQYEPFTLPARFAELLPPSPAIHIYHSKNDPTVPFVHFEEYERKLPGVVAHAIPGDSHSFSEGIPQLLRDIRQLG